MFNYKALKKWRKRCKLTQEEVSGALDLKERTSITTYENGKVNVGSINLGIIIDLFSTHLSASGFNEFITELFNIKAYKRPISIDINYPKWIKDKDRIIDGLEKELKECNEIIDYAKKNCKKKTCPILQKIA